jgi:hypothetical protein
MATGTVGNIRGADVSPSDVEIFYHFTQSRSVVGNTNLIKLNSNNVLSKVNNPNRAAGVTFEAFGGLYTLRLPVSEFSAKGIYTIIIKPLEIRLKITDVGVLSAYPNIKGVLFDLANVPTDLVDKFENNGLIGYRIEYLNESNSSDTKIPNLFRIITSNNRSEAVNQNLTNSNQKAIRYRFNDNSSLVFCTVSPSSAPNVKPNDFPFIGQPNQNVILTNTFFNPLVIELEMVDQDIETLSYGLFGNQSKSIDDGIYTIYNNNNQIYKQYNLFEIKDSFNGTPLFEVREERTNIDFTKNFNAIINV